MANLPPAVVIHGQSRLTGRLRLPGDKSISHRALLLGALANGTSHVRGLSDGDDVQRTAHAIELLGASITRPEPGVVRITGNREGLRAPDAAIDCGNSGTSMRLLAGVAAACPGRTVLTGDDSLRARPMDRVARPLELMGAQLQGNGPRLLPPVTIQGAALHGIEWSPEVASAQVKSAILLAGIQANGVTIVRERVPTRAHTEELLEAAGAKIQVVPWGSNQDGRSGGGGRNGGGGQRGRQITVERSTLHPLELDVPGDPSQAAFWVVAGAIVPGSSVTVRHLYAGKERTGFLGVLERMGALVDRQEIDHMLTVTVSAGALTATEVTASEIPSLDEVPVLAVAAAAAAGTTKFLSMGELRVKESDRLLAVSRLATAFGARAEIHGDDLLITGTGGRLIAASVDPLGDHRIAMAGAIGGLAATGPTMINDFSSVATSYPGFLHDLTMLAGEVWEPIAVGATEGQPSSLASFEPAGQPSRVEDGVSSRRTRPLIAIDGPAGAGKSTVTEMLSERLGVSRLDTGAMYRAVTCLVLRQGIDPTDEGRVGQVAEASTLDIDGSVVIDGIDVTDEIRTPEVNQSVSVVAANPVVRKALVEAQRSWVTGHGGGVVEGRDIGTVVLPQADLKVYLTASSQERARRRHEEGHDALGRRDHLDSNRSASPLAAAKDALVIDTTHRSVQDIVAEILSCL